MVPAIWPPQSIIKLLESLVAEHLEVIAQPPPHARLIGFDKDQNRFGLSFSIADPLIASRITSQLRLQAWEMFQRRGIFTQPPLEDEAILAREAAEPPPKPSDS